MASVLGGVHPNAENFVSTGVFNTRSEAVLIGCQANKSNVGGEGVRGDDVRG